VTPSFNPTRQPNIAAKSPIIAVKKPITAIEVKKQSQPPRRPAGGTNANKI